jgi:hypothetical protein
MNRGDGIVRGCPVANMGINSLAGPLIYIGRLFMLYQLR